MKEKLFWLAILIVAAIMVVGLIRLISGEDNWLCQNGQWVKHGQPSSPMPDRACQK